MAFFSIFPEGRGNIDSPILDDITVRLVWALREGLYAGNTHIAARPKVCGCGLKQFRTYDVYNVMTTNRIWTISAEALHTVACHRDALSLSEAKFVSELKPAPKPDTEKLRELGEHIARSFSLKKEQLEIFGANTF